MTFMTITDTKLAELEIENTLFESYEMALNSLNRTFIQTIHHGCHQCNYGHNEGNSDYKSSLCDRTAGFDHLKGQSLLHSKKKYEHFTYILKEDNSKVKISLYDLINVVDQIDQNRIYHIVKFYGSHDETSDRKCGSKIPLYRHLFTSEQNLLIQQYVEENWNLKYLKHFYEINFQKFYPCSYKQLSHKVSSILRQYNQDLQVSLMAKHYDITYAKDKNNIAFCLVNPMFVELFKKAQPDIIFMDFTFVKIGSNFFTIHFLSSILPSRFSFILAAYVVKVENGKSGEDKETLKASLKAFSEHAKCWENAKLVITDDGGVYTYLNKLIPETMLHEKCYFHFMQNFKSCFNSVTAPTKREVYNIKQNLKSQFYEMITASTPVEFEYKYNLLEKMLKNQNINLDLWNDLKNRKFPDCQFSKLDELLILTRKNYGGLTLGITTTQSLEGQNFTKLKAKLTRQSSFFDLVLIVSGCDVWEQLAILNHQRDNLHFKSEYLGRPMYIQGYVLKVQELLIRQDELSQQYIIDDSNESTIDILTPERQIIFQFPKDVQPDTLTCSCLTRQQSGIPCSHMFAIMYYKAWNEDQMYVCLSRNIDYKYTQQFMMDMLDGICQFQLHQLRNIKLPTVQEFNEDLVEEFGETIQEDNDEPEEIQSTKTEMLRNKLIEMIKKFSYSKLLSSDELLTEVENDIYYKIKNRFGGSRGTSKRFKPYELKPQKFCCK